MPIQAILFDYDGVLVKSPLSAQQPVQAIEGVQDTLRILQPYWAGKMACVSAAKYNTITKQLKLLHLLDYFAPHIYSGADTPRNKPHPDVYIRAIKALGIPARHSAVIEDSSIGIRAAVAAGAVVFAYTARSSPEQALRDGAHHTFTHMSELPALLLDFQ